MLGLIGWSRTTSDTWTLREYITKNTDAPQYDIQLGGPWVPAAGDVITDSLGVTDTVTGVISAIAFQGKRSYDDPNDWTTGWATVVRKVPARLASTANFRGPCSVLDDSSGKTTLTLGAGLVISDDLAINNRIYAPDGFADASTVIVSPQTDLLEIRGCHWHAPHGIKTITNGHATNRLVIKHEDGLAAIPETDIFMSDGADIELAPGESIALVRDNLGSNDRWRAARNSPSGIPLLLGTSLLLEWDSESGVTEDTPPDVEAWATTNGSPASAVQATPAEMPHKVTDEGRDALEFDNAASQSLATVTYMIPQGSYPTAFIVCKLSASTSPLTAGSQFTISSYTPGGLPRSQFLTLNNGTLTRTRSPVVSDPENLHVWRGSLRTNSIATAVDGTKAEATSTGNGGLAANNTEIWIGKDASTYAGGTFHHVIYAENPSDAQIDAVEAYLMTKYGIA